MIMKIIKWSSLALALFVIFLFLTFPLDSLSPLATRSIENFLRDAVQVRAQCQLNDLRLAFPVGMKWDRLVCTNTMGENIIDLGVTTLRLYFTSKVIETQIGQGRIDIKLYGGLKSPPSAVFARFQQAPLDRIWPTIATIFGRSLGPVPLQSLKLEGAIDGEFSLPLKNFESSNGKVDLRFPRLKIPTQSLLTSFVGLKEVNFQTAQAIADLANGRLTIKSLAFLSDPISAKIDGSLELKDQNIRQSTGNLTFKWKIQKSDALLGSSIGILISNLPCPNADAEGFCTRRLTRLQELFGY